MSLGFAGVVLINLNGSILDMGFKLTGEGFVLISAGVLCGIYVTDQSLFKEDVSGIVEWQPVFCRRYLVIYNRKVYGRASG